MAIGDIFKLAVVGTGTSGQQLVNTFHFRQEHDLIFDFPGPDLVDAWRETCEELFSACFGSGNSIRGYQVRGVTDPTYGFDSVLVEPVAGGLGGDALPPQDTTVTTWVTGLIGDSYRGRTYSWPFTESHQADGIISSGLRANLIAFAAANILLPITLTHTDWQLGVLSRYHNNVKRAEPLFTPIVEAVVRDYVFTQRRRHRSRGA